MANNIEVEEDQENVDLVEDLKELHIGSIYELRTKGFVSLKTLCHIRSWEDIIFFYSVEESVSLSSPKYTIPFSSRNNRTDNPFTSPKGAFFDSLLRQEAVEEDSPSSPSSSSLPSSPPLPQGIIIRFSDGRIEEFKPSEADFMKSLGVKTLLEREKIVTIKQDTLILLDYAYFSIGQKAYYVPKNFGIFLLYDPKEQRMVWMKTYLDFHQLFKLLKEDVSVLEKVMLDKANKMNETNETDEG
jgi:hypothetical protein